MTGNGPPPSAYAAALDYLYARTTGGVQLGLDRTNTLLDHLGQPHRAIPCFHVAGTNGKGSTVATAAALLSGRGFRVGTYTSPHLVDFRERIRIDGHPIAEQDVVEFIERHVQVIESIGATFFEATTALAFDHFVRGGATVCVIETGLGGRLDSTNVVDPVAAAVTSIDRDHTEYLGDSLEGIAREKGGIFKRGRPAVIGERDPVLREVLRTCAAEAGASHIRLVSEEMAIRDVDTRLHGTRFGIDYREESQTWVTPLVGDHQAANAACAWLMLEAAGDPYRVALADARAALSRVQLPGRFQREGGFIFDVAHNRAGSQVLAATLRQVNAPHPIVAVFCALADKDWPEMIAALAPVVDRFVFTNATTAPVNRAWSLDDVGAVARDRGYAHQIVEDFNAAVLLATNGAGTVLVTGSFHTVGDAMGLLQLSP